MDLALIEKKRTKIEKISVPQVNIHIVEKAISLIIGEPVTGRQRTLCVTLGTIGF
jgi:hypothetical protein